MNPKLIALLKDIADVLEKHNGGLTYTNHDDGVHVFIGDGNDRSEISIGWPENGNVEHIRVIIEDNVDLS